MAEADLSCRGVGGVDLRPVGKAAAVRRGFRERDLRGVKPREQDEVRAAEAISCSLLSRERAPGQRPLAGLRLRWSIWSRKICRAGQLC